MECGNDESSLGFRESAISTTAGSLETSEIEKERKRKRERERE